MSIANQKNPLTSVLVLLLLICLMTLVIEIALIQFSGGLLGGNTNTENHNPYQNYQAVELKSMPVVEEFQGVVDRSLFSWDRKPRFVSAETGTDNDVESRWDLTGVVNTGNETYAYFTAKNGSQSETGNTGRVQLQVGMFLEKWRVDRITPETVVLSLDGEEQEFRLVTDMPPPVRRPQPRARDNDTGQKQD
ncbi:hypothetical protein QP938_07630 [Porticoccaceae bacterium LTM1]|nr:hypothetical protein QP938_07630 [Porticoccaceae bacterium LTM1]